MDRNVFFGTESVPQWPSNLPTFASFLGHDIEGHEAFYTNHPVNIEASDFGALGEQLQDTHEMFQTHGLRIETKYRRSVTIQATTWFFFFNEEESNGLPSSTPEIGREDST
jgi:hypothetical protein